MDLKAWKVVRPEDFIVCRCGSKNFVSQQEGVRVRFLCCDCGYEAVADFSGESLVWAEA